MLIDWVKRKFYLFHNTKANPTWKEVERFDDAWKDRIRLMAGFIYPGEIVLDLGCGPMWLRDFLAQDVEYIAVDYTTRGAQTVICDFNKGEFPNIIADVFFVSGCLEYIIDYQIFIQKICAGQGKCILSYCTSDDFPNAPARRKRGWVNSLSRRDIVNAFMENGMVINHELKTPSRDTVFVFTGKKKKVIEE